MAEPVVSVVMPVLGPHPVYFRKAVESVLAQTLGELELVIVEDPSPVDGRDVLRGIDDPRIRHIRNEARTSLVDQRNRALAEARCDFVAMLDADDIAEPHRLRTQLDHMRAHPDLGVLGSNLTIIDGDGTQVATRSYPLDHAAIVHDMARYNAIAQPSVMCRRQIVLDAGGYQYRTFPVNEDYELWSRLATRGVRLANHPERLLRYRVHPHGTKAKMLHRMLRATIDVKQRYWLDQMNAYAKLRFYGEHVLLGLPASVVMRLFMITQFGGELAVKRFLRAAWPWLLGLAIIVVIATRVPLKAFGDAIHEGPHLRLLAVDLAVVVAVLFTDTFATWIALIVVGTRWTLPRTLAVRGATYILSLLNYAVGQGGIGFYLHRGGMPALRAAGVTLFTIGTTFATLLLLTTGAWGGGGHDSSDAMWWTLVGSCAAFAIYLAIIAGAPTALAKREVLAPLFDAGVRGHAIAVLARLPHVILIVLGHWFALLAWDVPVPFTIAATVMPAVVVAGVLPISPAGLGTIQAALVYFFSDYATGADADARAASILAFSIVHFVYGMLGQLAVGVVCIAPARRGDPPPQP